MLTGAVLFFQAFAGKPNEYITETVTTSSLSNEIEVTGVIHGEKEKTYYAEVTAPIAMLDLKVGDTVRAGEKIVEYDTWDLENTLANAQLGVESTQTSADGQVKDSNKKAAIYNKASSDVETYKFLYALARNDSDAIDIEQYSFCRPYISVIAIDKWRIKCIQYGILHTMLTTSTSHSHDSTAPTSHDGLHIMKVKIHITFYRYKFRYALCCVSYNLVCTTECFFQWDMGIGINVT